MTYFSKINVNVKKIVFIFNNITKNTFFLPFFNFVVLNILKLFDILLIFDRIV